MKRSIEQIMLRSPAEAIDEMNKLQSQLDKVHVQMLSTGRADCGEYGRYDSAVESDGAVLSGVR